MTEHKPNFLQLAQQIELEAGNSAAINNWNPPCLGELPMRIDQRGQWHYQGEIIKRDALITLFSKILRVEQAKYYLVTPVEKFLIQVDDLPFITHELQVHQQKAADGKSQTVLSFRLNQGTTISVGKQHPLVMKPLGASDQLLPAIYVGQDLFARVHRNHYYQLMEIVEAQLLLDKSGVEHEYYGVWSGGGFYPLEA